MNEGPQGKVRPSSPRAAFSHSYSRGRRAPFCRPESSSQAQKRSQFSKETPRTGRLSSFGGIMGDCSSAGASFGPQGQLDGTEARIMPRARSSSRRSARYSIHWALEISCLRISKAGTIASPVQFRPSAGGPYLNFPAGTVTQT